MSATRTPAREDAIRPRGAHSLGGHRRGYPRRHQLHRGFRRVTAGRNFAFVGAVRKMATNPSSHRRMTLDWKYRSNRPTASPVVLSNVVLRDTTIVCRERPPSDLPCRLLSSIGRSVVGGEATVASRGWPARLAEGYEKIPPGDRPTVDHAGLGNGVRPSGASIRIYSANSPPETGRPVTAGYIQYLS